MTIALPLIFLLGLVIGSFLNVVIIRKARRQSVRGRSKCESCKKKLSAKELIPVFSFLFQKRRCLQCGAAFSIQYPLVELATAISFAISFWLWPATAINIWYWLKILAVFIGVSATIVIFVSDLRYKIIPNGAVFILLILGIITLFFRAGQIKIFAVELVYALAPAVFLGVLWLVSRGHWMGLGDVKLIFTTSLILGFPASLIAFLFSFWLGGLAGALLLLLQRKNLKSQIPFGPFILIGTILAYFFSPSLMLITGLYDII